MNEIINGNMTECFMFHSLGCETVKQNENHETVDET